MKQVEIEYINAATHIFDLEDAAAEEMVATLSAGQAFRYETTWRYDGGAKWAEAPHVKYPVTRVILPWAIASIMVRPTRDDAKRDLAAEELRLQLENANPTTTPRPDLR